MAAGDQRRLAARFGGRPYKLRVSVAAGAGADTDITLTGIKPGDVLVGVIDLTDGTDIVDTTSITEDDTIQNSASTSGDTLLVVWYSHD